MTRFSGVHQATAHSSTFSVCRRLWDASGNETDALTTHLARQAGLEVIASDRSGYTSASRTFRSRDALDLARALDDSLQDDTPAQTTDIVPLNTILDVYKEVLAYE